MKQGIADSIIRRVERLVAGRSTFEAQWQEIAERVIPRQSGTFLAPATDFNKGEKRTNKMFDSTAALGLERFSAAMESMLTPRNNKWHRLRATNEYLNRDREVALWFEDINDILFQHRYSPRANYASQQHEIYMSLGAFGTACMFIDELDTTGLRYRAVHLGEVFFMENHQGLIDTCHRKFTMTARQAAQKWDESLLPDNIMKALNENSDKEFEFIHCVKPREEMDVSKADYRGMQYASYYVSIEGKKLLSEGGYQTFPYAISRYVTAPGEVYGRSPAMLALPAIKVLNEQKKTMLKQGHRVVDPVLLAHDDGVVDSFSLKPGSINYGGVSADGRRLIQELPVGNLAAGQELMDMERTVINEAFLVSLFQILVDSPQMTATEVLERAREKGALLSPTMGRQQSEALGPMIEREIDLLSRQGLLPDMPPLLVEAEGEFSIEYDSPLSRAQKAEEASGLFRTIEFATQFSNVTGDPSPFDHIDIDEAMPAIMGINAVPERWKRGEKDIESVRQQRAEQAQMQQMIEAAPSLASAAKTAGIGE